MLFMFENYLKIKYFYKFNNVIFDQLTFIFPILKLKHH